MHKLEDLVSDDIKLSIKDPYCIIFDGHAIIQILPQSSTLRTTFRQMADRFMCYIVNGSKSARHIHVVFDTYKENSIKNQTRLKRGQILENKKVHNRPDAAILKDWKSFLSVGKNKQGSHTTGKTGKVRELDTGRSRP